MLKNMQAPAFWWRPKPNALALLLAPFGWMWGLAAKARLAQAGARAEIPVICVGNFVAGGAGKTPTAIVLARLLQTRSEKPVFLSRGYGGDLASRVPLQVDLKRHDARDVGDEPLLLAAVAPTIVCTDRVAGANAARAMGASVVIMDDGMQNPSLAKDVMLAVVDGASGVGNRLCIPAGPLRAPLSAQAFSALVVIGGGVVGDAVAARAASGKPIFRASMTPDAHVAMTLNERNAVAFAGIGRPEKFFRTLEQTGARIIARRAFADHHVYTKDEIEDLRELASLTPSPRLRGEGGGGAANPAFLVTTEKDFVRLPPDMRDGVIALPANLVFEDQENFARWLFAQLAKVRAAR